MYKLRLVWLALAMITSSDVMAASADEIQVYDEAINKVGELNVDIHMNYVGSGAKTPSYIGEIPSNHNARVTPEFGYGMTNNLEAGLYVPFIRAANGNGYLEGLKIRLISGNSHTPGFSPAFKISHKTTERTWLNVEHYSDFGDMNNMHNVSQESYLSAETEIFGHDLNIGIGHGWTGTDNLTIKAIFNVPL